MPHPQDTPQPTARAPAAPTDPNRLRRWRWVVLLVLVVFASSASLASLVGLAYHLFGEGAVKAGSFTLLLLAALALLGLVLPRLRSRLTAVFLLKLILLAGGYLLALTCLAPYPVEKLHFLEYGFLAFLTWRAFRNGGGSNPLFKTVSLVFFIGFMDEVWQGFLPQRRYDDQDVLVNFVAAALGLLTTLLLDDRRTGVRRGFSRPANLACLSLWPLGILLYLYIHAVPVPTEELWGTWERIGDCSVNETLTMKPDGTFTWKDDDGGRAIGTFRVKANRLEGLQWGVRVTQGETANTCGWRKGLSMEFKVAVYADRFVILSAPDRPWRRLFAD